MTSRLNYPPTRVQEVTETLFGTPVRDPYRWLEDEKSPEVRAWMEKQDRFARERLAALPGRDRLAERLRALLYYDSFSAPLHRGNRFFYTRRHADREKAIVYWKEGESGEERVLIDPNRLSADGTVSLGTWVPTLDGKRVAYTLRPNNADEATLHVMEVATGKRSAVDVIPGLRYGDPDWTPEGDGFYYTWFPTDPAIPVDERPGHADIRFHHLGTPPTGDRVVHGPTGDPRRTISADLSRDGRWLFLYIWEGWDRADVYFRDLRAAAAAWRPFLVGAPALVQVTPWRDHFYLRTNEGAPRWRVLRTRNDRPERAHWQEIVPERQDVVIENVHVLGEHLVLELLHNASNRIEVRSLAGEIVRDLPLPDLGSANSLTGNPDEEDAYFSFSTFTRPTEVYRTSLRGGDTKLWAWIKIPVDTSPYSTEQVWYRSKDGTKVSMFIVRRREAASDGSTPFLLTGYGGFNVSELPGFAASRMAWLEAGGGFALPNLRGGGEYGEEWHRAGMLHHKQNVFDDFIAAAEYLVKEGYTKPERLAISGGSNGGLLVGAAITQRPELFRAAICGVPLLDMVRYHRFGMGRIWIPEYGSADDGEQFKTLFGYSPYHRVKPGARYPAVLFTSADSDDRVDPMHARKMAALLQAATGNDRPILLRIEKHAGHGGADLVRQQVELAADTYAFLMRELGMRAG